MVKLWPGNYTVTFTHEGFRACKREGITLGFSFTATVNADLGGQTSQQMTVSDAPPLVAVQVADGARGESLHPGNTTVTMQIFAVHSYPPGIRSTPDVGGTSGMQQPTLEVHGSNADDNSVGGRHVDSAHRIFGSRTGRYYNDSQMQAITYLTSSLPAEAPVGSIQIEYAPANGREPVPRVYLEAAQLRRCNRTIPIRHWWRKA